jgi:hypothetical protein
MGMAEKPEAPKVPVMVWAVVTVLGAAIPITPQVINALRPQAAVVQPAPQPAPPAPQPQPTPAPPAPQPAPQPAPPPPQARAVTAQDWYNRGLQYQQIGDHENAIEAFKQVLVSTDATRTRTCTKCTFAHKAQSEEYLGYYDEALASYQGALEHSQNQQDVEYYQYQIYRLSQR